MEKILASEDAIWICCLYYFPSHRESLPYVKSTVCLSYLLCGLMAPRILGRKHEPMVKHHLHRFGYQIHLVQQTYFESFLWGIGFHITVGFFHAISLYFYIFYNSLGRLSNAFLLVTTYTDSGFLFLAQA